MIHSTISIANEYVSDSFVAEVSVASRSSGAANLTKSPDVIDLEDVVPLMMPEIVAISKSQTSGLPLPL